MIVRPEAEADIASGQEWYDRQRLGLGQEFVLAVEEMLRRVENSPALYRVVYRGVRRAIIPKFPYSLYFRADDGEIMILALMHFRRSSRHWLQRI